MLDFKFLWKFLFPKLMIDPWQISVSERVRPVAGVQRGGLPALVPAARHHRRLLRHSGTLRDGLNRIGRILPYIGSCPENTSHGKNNWYDFPKYRQTVYRVAICPRGNLPYIQITSIVLPYSQSTNYLVGKVVLNPGLMYLRAQPRYRF